MDEARQPLGNSNPCFTMLLAFSLGVATCPMTLGILVFPSYLRVPTPYLPPTFSSYSMLPTFLFSPLFVAFLACSVLQVYNLLHCQLEVLHKF